MLLQINTYIDMCHYMYIYIYVYTWLFVIMMAVDVALSFEVLDLRLQGVALRALEICQRDLASLDHTDRTQIRVHFFCTISYEPTHSNTTAANFENTNKTKTIYEWSWGSDGFFSTFFQNTLEGRCRPWIRFDQVGPLGQQAFHGFWSHSHV